MIEICFLLWLSFDNNFGNNFGNVIIWRKKEIRKEKKDDVLGAIKTSCYQYIKFAYCFSGTANFFSRLLTADRYFLWKSAFTNLLKNAQNGSSFIVHFLIFLCFTYSNNYYFYFCLFFFSIISFPVLCFSWILPIYLNK